MVAKNFQTAGERVVVIENDGNNPYIPQCHEMGISVIHGNARDAYTLRKAGVAGAQALIAVSAEDGANADIAVKARSLLNPGAES